MSGKYRTIVADPPWSVGAGPEWSSNGPRLFARRARFGWDYWGNESLGTAELEAA